MLILLKERRKKETINDLESKNKNEKVNRDYDWQHRVMLRKFEYYQHSFELTSRD